MFFPERIVSIRADDRVLEVGPGGTPHPRSDVFLEKHYDDPIVFAGQRGHAPPLRTQKPIVVYGGGRFPFADDSFDYVICSQVLEHIEDVEMFLRELSRVSARGYMEFPTIFYDWIYDFKEHVTCLLYKEGKIFWLPKADIGLEAYRPVTSAFYETMCRGYTNFLRELKPFLFQGFEWQRPLIARRVSTLEEIVFHSTDFPLPFRTAVPTPGGCVRRLRNALRWRWRRLRADAE